MKDFSNKIYTEGLFIPLMEISLKFLEKISIFYVIRLLFGEKQQNPPKEEIPEPKLVGATSQEKRNLFKPRCSLIFGFSSTAFFLSVSSLSRFLPSQIVGNTSSLFMEHYAYLKFLFTN